MVLMASLSCRISPRTSTVIFFDRSPLATAMVTSEMLRTWAVRLLAIRLTLSVRSFQTPVTSRTCAWPPSLPSVPTSRATRVTSEVNTLSCLIMVLTIVAERRNSPFSGLPSTSRRMVTSKIALGHRFDGARRLGGRPQQIVDQGIDRILHLAPGPHREAEAEALAGAAFLADDLADMLQLLRDMLVGRDDLVEGVGDLAEDAGRTRQPCERKSRPSASPATREATREDRRLGRSHWRWSERQARSATRWNGRQPQFGLASSAPNTRAKWPDGPYRPRQSGVGHSRWWWQAPTPRPRRLRVGWGIHTPYCFHPQFPA